ncbi:sugar transferase [Caproicibacterium sp. NSD3]
MYQKYIKRILDIVCALLAMIVFCWLYAIIAILVRIKLGSPVIFKQKRPGKINPKTGQEQIFTLYKFRTMTDDKDVDGNLLSDAIRLTKFGKFLRSTSLDELPEAWNIFKGNMSVIGPRPLLVEYLPLYNQRQRQRHKVRPGLSGWAQVNGRNAIRWEDKFELDVWYVDHISFLLDIKIVFQTIWKTVKRDGVNHENAATMMKFQGTKNHANV